MTIRLAVVALAAAALLLATGCGGGADEATPRPSPAAGAMGLASSSLGEGLIPSEYSCDGADVSPEMSWQGAPGETRAFAMIMDDPDAGGFVHWLVYDIAASTSALPRALPATETLSGGAKQGKNSFGDIGYGGPCPPEGSDHSYRFRIFALDAATGLAPGASAQDVIEAIDGHVLASGELTRRYRR